MAQVFANMPVNFQSLKLNPFLSGVRFMQDNVNVQLTGVTQAFQYADIYSMHKTDSYGYSTIGIDLFGSSLKYNAASKTLTGGYVNALSFFQYGLEWDITGFSIRATEFMAAFKTRSVSDDQKLYQKMFSGNDLFSLNSPDNVVHGFKGNDTINGSGGTDRLFGDEGTDTLDGRLGNDSLNGGTGNDILNGGDGNDSLRGSTGLDTLNGGADNDKFLYMAPKERGDSIIDFAQGDKFVFEGSAFSLGQYKGALDAANFLSTDTNQAGDADDYFIYRTTDDTLWFNAGGNGATAPIKIADLTNDYDLQANGILIF